MASPIGIGDACFLIGTAITLCKDIRDAPNELEAAARDMKLMEAIMWDLRDEIGDEQSFMSRRKDISNVIIDNVKPLREDLKEIEQMLNDYLYRPSITILGRLRYAVLDKTRLRDLCSTFAVHRGSITVILQLIQGKAVKEQSMKLDRILECHKKERQERKSSTRRIEDILSQIHTLVHYTGPDMSKTTAEALQKLEDELVAKGIPRDQASQQLLPFKQALLPDSLRPASNAVPQSKPKRPVSNPNPESTDRKYPGTGHARSRSSMPTIPVPTPNIDFVAEITPGVASAAPNTTPMSNPNGNTPVSPGVQSTIKDTSSLRILCVDGSNGIRSILSQAYLEIMRVWIAHRTGRWIFKRVDSAGINVDSGFATQLIKGIPYRNAGVTIPKEYLSGINSEDYRWSYDYPDEVSSILNRIKRREIRGLVSEDFGTYGIIICFNETVKRRLAQMRSLSDQAKRDATKILTVPCIDFDTEECLVDGGKMQLVVDSIKAGIKSFLITHLNANPVCELDKGFRVAQFTVPGGSGFILEEGQKIDDAPQIIALERQSGCSIKIYEGYKAERAPRRVIGIYYWTKRKQLLSNQFDKSARKGGGYYSRPGSMESPLHVMGNIHNFTRLGGVFFPAPRLPYEG